MAIQVAFTTGTSQNLSGAEAQLSQWHELHPGLGDILARLRADSVLPPLIVAGRPLGVLALARDAERPDFAETDVAVAEEFARPPGRRDG